MAKQRNFTPPHPFSPEQLADLRRQFAQLSITALYDAHNAARVRCKVERNGRAPRAEHIQEFVQVWRELRKSR